MKRITKSADAFVEIYLTSDSMNKGNGETPSEKLITRTAVQVCRFIFITNVSHYITSFMTDAIL
jgi:hypothetical protein